jgi:hypothetical protein
MGIMTDPGLDDGEPQGDGQSESVTGSYRSLASGDLKNTWQLGEFFDALGSVMRLPPKAPRSAAAATPVVSARAAHRSRFLIPAAVALLAIAVLQRPLLHLLSPDVPVPEGLLGSWITDAPRYADRGFVITSDSLRLQLGPQLSATYPITRVRRAGTADSARYTISYRQGDTEVEMGLSVDPELGLRVANLPSVTWRRGS